MAVYVTRAIEARGLGQHYTFVTRDIQTGRIVGATRFYDMTPWDWSTGPAKANQRHGRPDTVSIGPPGWRHRHSGRRSIPRPNG